MNLAKKGRSSVTGGRKRDPLYPHGRERRDLVSAPAAPRSINVEPGLPTFRQPHPFSCLDRPTSALLAAGDTHKVLAGGARSLLVAGAHTQLHLPSHLGGRAKGQAGGAASAWGAGLALLGG